MAVSIPRIGVRSRLVELGLNADGAMEVPQDPAVAGWYSRGAAPGALGPAVIAGHVSWNGTPGVFHRLGTLRRGDQVAVTRKDGKTAVFTVTRVTRFSKSRFPTREVYGEIDHAGLRLITCGGTYDSPGTGTWTTSLSSPDWRRCGASRLMDRRGQLRSLAQRVWTSRRSLGPAREAGNDPAAQTRHQR